MLKENDICGIEDLFGLIKKNPKDVCKSQCDCGEALYSWVGRID